MLITEQAMVLAHLSSIFKYFKLFWESYLPTTEFKITGPVGTILWILSSIWRAEVAIAALLVHIGPLVLHYIQNRPFGIQFSYTPVRSEGGNPDLISADKDQAILENGSCVLVGKVDLRESLSSFSLRFESSQGITVELRDIPEREHVYQKDENILSAEEIESYQFQLVFNIYDNLQNKTSRGFLEIVDQQSGNLILSIELIRS